MTHIFKDDVVVAFLAVIIIVTFAIHYNNVYLNIMNIQQLQQLVPLTHYKMHKYSTIKMQSEKKKRYNTVLRYVSFKF